MSPEPEAKYSAIQEIGLITVSGIQSGYLFPIT